MAEIVRAPVQAEELGRMEIMSGGVRYEFIYLGRCYQLYRNGVELKPIPRFKAFEAAFKAFETECGLELAEEIFK